MGKSSKKKERMDKINVLRKQYDAFLEEDKKRKDRNEYILGRLDNMRAESMTLRNRYNLSLQPIEAAPKSKNEICLNRNSFSKTLINKQLEILPEENDLIRKISKKYILIPKHYTLLPTDSNVANTNETGNDSDWKMKYDILDQLKRCEKENLETIHKNEDYDYPTNDKKTISFHVSSDDEEKYNEPCEKVRNLLNNSTEGPTNTYDFKSDNPDRNEYMTETSYKLRDRVDAEKEMNALETKDNNSTLRNSKDNNEIECMNNNHPYNTINKLENNSQVTDNNTLKLYDNKNIPEKESGHIERSYEHNLQNIDNVSTYEVPIKDEIQNEEMFTPNPEYTQQTEYKNEEYAGNNQIEPIINEFEDETVIKQDVEISNTQNATSDYGNMITEQDRQDTEFVSAEVYNENYKIQNGNEQVLQDMSSQDQVYEENYKIENENEQVMQDISSQDQVYNENESTIYNQQQSNDEAEISNGNYDNTYFQETGDRVEINNEQPQINYNQNINESNILPETYQIQNNDIVQNMDELENNADKNTKNVSEEQYIQEQQHQQPSNQGLYDQQQYSQDNYDEQQYEQQQYEQQQYEQQQYDQEQYNPQQYSQEDYEQNQNDPQYDEQQYNQEDYEQQQYNQENCDQQYNENYDPNQHIENNEVDASNLQMFSNETEPSVQTEEK